MRFDGEDLKIAFIALSVGLEPVIFAIVGWYAGPYLNLTNTAGALIGVVVGLVVMFWRIWKLSSMLGLGMARDPEREVLRPLASFIEAKRHKIIGRSGLLKIMNARSPQHLLTTLKDLSLVSYDFYDLKKLDEVLNEVVDFSKTLSEVRAQSSINFLRALRAFNDFLTILCINFAFRHKVGGDELAEGYVVPPFKFEGDVRDLLREDLVNQLADREIRELCSEALNEGLAINSRSPILALAAYSLMKMAKVLEENGYARAYSKEVKELALELLSIAANELRAKGGESKVMKMIEQKDKSIKTHIKKSKKGALKKEEDVLRSFINEAYKALISSARVPCMAKTVFSYLFVKWGEKVSLKLALMATTNGVPPHRAFASLLIPC